MPAKDRFISPGNPKFMGPESMGAQEQKDTGQVVGPEGYVFSGRTRICADLSPADYQHWSGLKNALKPFAKLAFGKNFRLSDSFMLSVLLNNPNFDTFMYESLRSFAKNYNLQSNG